MRITPEKNSFENKLLEENKLPSIFTVKRKDTGIFSAITLSLILVACGGGGGGGGSVATTPTTDDGTDDGSDGGSAGTTSGTAIDLDGGAYSATSAADAFTFDVSFADSSIVALDNNVSITGFDPATDSIVLRGTGGSASLTSSTLLSATGVDVSSSTINNNTVIYFSPNSSGSSSSITLEGVVDEDLSTISISAKDGAANDTSSTTASSGSSDLSSGTVTATASPEAYVYEVKFVDGSPVAIDGNVTIKGFDVANDTITLQASSIPAGFAKSSLLTAAGVDVVSSTIDNSTTIYFAPDASGTSGSITLDGVVDADLSSITISVLSGSVTSGGVDLSSGSNIELGTDDLTAQAGAENFVFDVTYASSTISGSDGPITITGFDQSKDKLVILASDMPVGYDLADFKLASSVDISASTINNNTTIYFAPDADGSSTSITLAGVVDADLSNTSIVFTSSLTGATSSGTATSTDTSASDDAATVTEEPAVVEETAEPAEEAVAEEETAVEETTAEAATYNVVEIASATEDTTVNATDGADEFRYEFTGSTSSEGNFIITIDGFDTVNDKIVFVNVGGDDLTTAQFKDLSGVEVSGNSFDNQTRILFDKDSSGGSGELAINGVYDSDLTTITIEILSDTNVTASTSCDFG